MNRWGWGEVRGGLCCDFLLKISLKHKELLIGTFSESARPNQDADSKKPSIGKKQFRFSFIVVAVVAVMWSRMSQSSGPWGRERRNSNLPGVVGGWWWGGVLCR